MNDDCLFCKIVNGDIASEKVYEDDTIFAFMDMKPVSRGHVLVVPKKHSNDLLSTDDEVLEKFLPSVKKLAGIIVKAVNAVGINISSNNGAAAGQSVFHLHFHLIPRFGNDNLPAWPHHLTEHKTRAEVAELIRKNL